MSGLVWLGVLLLVAWAVLWLGLNVVGGVVHLLVLAAVVFIVWGFVKRGARAVDRRL
jgi:uncharacterized membrane protein (DUF485 family)